MYTTSATNSKLFLAGSCPLANGALCLSTMVNPALIFGCGRVVQGAGRKAKRMVLQCINGVGLNPVEGRTKI